MRPLVKATSSRLCIIPSQPARLTEGPMNLEQMSRSLRSFLFMEVSLICGLSYLLSPGKPPRFLPFGLSCISSRHYLVVSSLPVHIVRVIARHFKTH
jgi:hypothetical protein